MIIVLVVAALALAADAFDVATAPPAAVVERAKARVAALKTYRVRFTKEERLDRGWAGPQVMDLVVREEPYAVRAEVVAGKKQGQRFVYDATQNKTQLRVREPGVLGLVALWVDVASGLAHEDTRHDVTELGYGFVFRTVERDAKLGKDRFTLVDEGLDPAGSRCVVVVAPAGVAGLYAQKTRLCFDKTALLTRVDAWDDKGAVERLAFQLVDPNVVEADPFSLAAHGL